MPLPGVDQAVWFRTPNLTSAKGSALNDFPGREFFVARFQRGGREYPGSAMAWEAFARMKTEDLGAIYEFLLTVPPADGPTGDPTFRRED